VYYFDILYYSVYQLDAQGGIKVASQVLNMRYPLELLERIDKVKEQRGFQTRTQAIIFLLQYALEQLGKK
jgi:metal-responsive CopG/Arc/MetJ family transcriptional regulator